MLPEIPKGYLIFSLMFGMVVLAALDIDTWTHATLGAITGYLIGENK